MGLIVSLLLSLTVVAAFAEEKIVCVSFAGIEHCESTTVIKIGDKEIPIDDPFAILNSIGNSEAEKVSLWNDYSYPPFLTELSKQLKITEDELIYELKDADSAWSTLYELVVNYDDLRASLKGETSDVTIKLLFDKVIESITDDIKEKLKDYEVQA